MKFKVTTVPAGEAPLQIRSQWVGVTLPVTEVLGPVTGYGVISSTRSEMQSAVSVSIKDAIQALRDADMKEAADWWEKMPQGYLLFEESEGELII